MHSFLHIIFAFFSFCRFLLCCKVKSGWKWWMRISRERHFSVLWDDKIRSMMKAKKKNQEKETTNCTTFNHACTTFTKYQAYRSALFASTSNECDVIYGEFDKKKLLSLVSICDDRKTVDDAISLVVAGKHFLSAINTNVFRTFFLPTGDNTVLWPSRKISQLFKRISHNIFSQQFS